MRTLTSVGVFFYPLGYPFLTERLLVKSRFSITPLSKSGLTDTLTDGFVRQVVQYCEDDSQVFAAAEILADGLTDLGIKKPPTT
jgi:hypothetical protein